MQIHIHTICTKTDLGLLEFTAELRAIPDNEEEECINIFRRVDASGVIFNNRRIVKRCGSLAILAKEVDSVISQARLVFLEQKLEKAMHTDLIVNLM